MNSEKSASGNGKTGILGVGRSSVALVAPQQQPGGDTYRYGVAFPFQVGPRKAALSVSLRVEGYPVGDFESGADAILFDDLSDIADRGSMPLTQRNEKYVDEQTGQPRIIIRYPTIGGFIPFEALREDGSEHPHAGTGFGLNQMLDFPMRGDGYYSKSDKTTAMIRNTEIHQLTYDGREFRVAKSELKSPDSPPRAPGSEWALVWPGLHQAIPDGDDLLYPILAAGGDASTWRGWPMASGVSRWQRADGLWGPVEFIPIAHSRKAAEPRIIHGKPSDLLPLEPSVIRDTDGSLLFTVRGVGDDVEDHAVRVWRSADSGSSWQLIIDLEQARGQAPITINTAADGTPYLVGNPLGRERDCLAIWPVNEERTGLLEPIVVRDALEEYGPPPSGDVWFMDHPNAATLRLRDGKWRNVLSYRIMDRGEHSGGKPAAQTGQYLEEVVSKGQVVSDWRFTE